MGFFGGVTYLRRPRYVQSRSSHKIVFDQADIQRKGRHVEDMSIPRTRRPFFVRPACVTTEALTTAGNNRKFCNTTHSSGCVAINHLEHTVGAWSLSPPVLF